MTSKGTKDYRTGKSTIPSTEAPMTEARVKKLIADAARHSWIDFTPVFTNNGSGGGSNVIFHVDHCRYLLNGRMLTIDLGVQLDLIGIGGSGIVALDLTVPEQFVLKQSANRNAVYVHSLNTYLLSSGFPGFCTIFPNTADGRSISIRPFVVSVDSNNYGSYLPTGFVNTSSGLIYFSASFGLA